MSWPLPCATFSYCPLDMAECRTVWKRLDSDVIPLCSLALLTFPSNAPMESSPLLLARLFWFSLFTMAAKRRRFGLGSWKISCQIENKLRWESFWPMSIDCTCSSHTRPCLLCINWKDENCIKFNDPVLKLWKPLALCFTTFWLGHVQKSKFLDKSDLRLKAFDLLLGLLAVKKLLRKYHQDGQFLPWSSHV